MEIRIIVREILTLASNAHCPMCSLASYIRRLSQLKTASRLLNFNVSTFNEHHECTTMNVFSNFISCMYPEIIRTDSIESLEQDCRFQAVNIDEHDEMISRGELQITNDHLIYFIPSKFPTRWPLSSIKTYGFIDHSKFVFEVAKGRPSGPPVYYAFILTRGSEFKEKIENRISRLALSVASDEENDGLLGGCTRLSLKRNNNNQADLTSQTTSLINNNNKTADPKPLNCLDENIRVQFESTRVRVAAQVK